MKSLSPWTVLTLAGCFLLALVDLWRDAGPTSMPIVRGTLPNLVAVPTLTFGFLMLRFPSRGPRKQGTVVEQRRWFWTLWGLALTVTIVWEFAQRTGALVFDPLDLVATTLGAALAVGAFVLLQHRSFLDTTNIS